MFFASSLLTKKGPLGKVWLAAHWDKKLTKIQVFQTDITKSVGTYVLPPPTHSPPRPLPRPSLLLTPPPPPPHPPQTPSSTRPCPWRSASRATSCWAWCASTRARSSTSWRTAPRRSPRSRWCVPYRARVWGDVSLSLSLCARQTDSLLLLLLHSSLASPVSLYTRPQPLTLRSPPHPTPPPRPSAPASSTCRRARPRPRWPASTCRTSGTSSRTSSCSGRGLGSGAAALAAGARP